METLYAGRRRRAKACLKAVGDDLSSADKRRKAANDQLTLLETELEELKLEIAQKAKSLQAVQDESKWCAERVKLRTEQKELLEDRLENGWEDERELEEDEESEEE